MSLFSNSNAEDKREILTQASESSQTTLDSPLFGRLTDFEGTNISNFIKKPILTYLRSRLQSYQSMEENHEYSYPISIAEDFDINNFVNEFENSDK